MQIQTLTMSGSGKVVKTKLFIGNLDPGTQAGLDTIHFLMEFQCVLQRN